MLADNVIKTIQTYMIQGIFIGVCVYFMEILIKYFYMQDEIHKSERIKMVSEMAASVAHEIRNPLTTVRGFIQLLASENVKSTEKEFYQKISLEELSRADQIISNYLSLAKAGNESIQLLNVAEEINYLENVLSTYANYNNIQIRTNHSDPNGLYYITGDKNKFRQALINIGKNAIEAMQNGGSLEIRMYELGERIFISIKDNGIGMTPEQINRLGTPYYSTKEKGTGLGTMVTFSIIKKMNGKIEIKSEKGKGTEYIISFPK
jgi:two-component system sporulation sensor kinase B